MHVLGPTSELDASALHLQGIAKSRIYYMEGYFAASPTGLAAAVQGRQIAIQHKVATALTFSDVIMINFCRAGLEVMIGDGLDYLFANEEEAQTWCGTDLPPASRTKVMAVSPQILENCGYY